MAFLPVLFGVLSLILALVSQNLKEAEIVLDSGFLLVFAVPGHLVLFSYVVFAIGRKSFLDDELKLRIGGRDIAPGILTGLLVLVAATALSILFPAASSGPAHNFAFDGLGPVLILYMIFSSVVAPIVEELVFRGFLWKILEEKKINKVLILLITSVLFAMMHLDPARFPALFAGGMIYGLLRMKKGNAGRSIIAHITNNTIVTILTFVLPLFL